ncbi:MAG: hypothetical protein HY906_19230 [Deltaproteobacteria bacterium]|nr:hypothetical protein [Deltaproteobacteria bacterium]
MESAKTTFYLTQSLRARLKAAAAHHGKSVKQLLAEGAELVLARYQGVADQEELRTRAAAAREKLRTGLYAGPSLSDAVDDVVYRPSSPGRRRPSSDGRGRRPGAQGAGRT